MITSDLEAISVPPVQPGPPSGHGNNVIVEHDNPLATDHQIATRDTASAIEQEWDLERATRGANSLKDID